MIFTFLSCCVKRLMIIKNAIMNIQNLAMNHESWPVKSNLAVQLRAMQEIIRNNGVMGVMSDKFQRSYQFFLLLNIFHFGDILDQKSTKYR